MIINSSIKSKLELRSNKLDSTTNNNIEIGLLIGQNSELNEQQTYVLDVFPTPLSIGEDGKVNSLESISSIDKEWVLDYCIQIDKMLYGGISIVGIYLITPDSDTLTEKNDTILMKLLKSLDTYPSFCCFKSSSNIQFISYSKKTNLINGKLTTQLLYRLKSTELKIIDNLENEFISLHCYFPIDILTTATTIDVNINELKDNIDQVFSDQLFFENVKNNFKSVFLIENEHVYDDDLLPIGGLHKDKSKLMVDILTNRIVKLTIKKSQLRFNLINNNNSSNNNNITHCIAYIHKLESIKTSLNYLKRDITKSVQSRFDILHSEQLLKNSNSNQSILILSSNIELPRRANIKWIGNNDHALTMCDYLLSGDDIVNFTKTISELLQIDSPKINSIEQSLIKKEEIPTTTTTTTKTSPKLQAQPQQQNNSNNSYVIIFIIAIIVLIVSFYFK